MNVRKHTIRMRVWAGKWQGVARGARCEVDRLAFVKYSWGLPSQSTRHVSPDLQRFKYQILCIFMFVWFFFNVKVINKIYTFPRVQSIEKVLRFCAESFVFKSSQSKTVVFWNHDYLPLSSFVWVFTKFCIWTYIWG